MYKPLESIFETSGFDEQSRSRYSMDVFFQREVDTAPRHLFDYWSTVSVGLAGLPSEALCYPRLSVPAGSVEWVSWIDTTSEDPMEFVIWDHCKSSVPGLGPELSGRPLGNVREAPLHISACVIEYLYCKHERVPMYHEIEQILCGYKRHYTRLMVPVEDESGNVRRIYYAVRSLRATTRVDQVTFGVS